MATNYYLCPLASFLQLFTDTGVPLSGALIWTYVAGTSTPTATWTDISGVTPNANPILLNSAGRLPNVSIWQQAGVAIKVVFSTNAGTTQAPVFGSQIGPTFDYISGIDDFTIANSLLGNPASGDGADLVANAVRSYDVFATARAANVPVLQAGQTLIVIFEGGNSIADNLGGQFYWNAASTAADDALTIIAPTGQSIGRYIRTLPLPPLTASKSNGSSSSSTTITIDADLQITIPAAGTYLIEAWLNDAGGSSAGGLQGQISFSNPFTVGYWSMNGVGTGVTAAPLTTVGTPGEFQSSQAGTGSMKIDGLLQCGSSGILSFQWAQHASNVTPTVLAAGSWMRVMRLSSATGTGNFTPVTHTYTSAGPGIETFPLGASTVTIEGFGGSGGGGADSVGFGGGGGGSGGYFRYAVNIAAESGQTLSYNVGLRGGAHGGVAGSSTVTSGTFAIPTLTAVGGTGGVASDGVTGGAGGAGGSASGGQTNTSGNAGGMGTNLVGGAGGVALTGFYSNGTIGSDGSLPNTGGLGTQGLPGVISFHYV